MFTLLSLLLAIGNATRTDDPITKTIESLNFKVANALSIIETVKEPYRKDDIAKSTLADLRLSQIWSIRSGKTHETPHKFYMELSIHLKRQEDVIERRFGDTRRPEYRTLIRDLMTEAIGLCCKSFKSPSALNKTLLEFVQFVSLLEAGARVELSSDDRIILVDITADMVDRYFEPGEPFTTLEKSASLKKYTASMKRKKSVSEAQKKASIDEKEANAEKDKTSGKKKKKKRGRHSGLVQGEGFAFHESSQQTRTPSPVELDDALDSLIDDVDLEIKEEPSFASFARHEILQVCRELGDPRFFGLCVATTVGAFLTGNALQTIGGHFRDFQPLTNFSEGF